MIGTKKTRSKKSWYVCLVTTASALLIMGTISLTSDMNVVQADTNGSLFIYDNGPFRTGTTTNSGTAAPAGFQWSEVQNPTGNTNEANSTSGVSCSVTTTVFRCADNFTVPAGQTWTINQVVTYAYQTGGPATTPFTAATLRIWNGVPGGGGTVIFGDTTTNRLGTSTDAAAYRVFNTVVASGATPPTAPGTTRRIWQNPINVSPAQVLTAGTYWIDWNTTVTASAAHFAPSTTTVGSRGLPTWNAIQSADGGATYTALADLGIAPTGQPAPAAVPQDFPFKLTGSISTPVVSTQHVVDYNGDGRTDLSVARVVNGQIVWINQLSGSGTTQGQAWGTSAMDFLTPSDFDGDAKSDLAVWRPGAAGTARFYILQSATNTVRIDAFGQTADDPSVVGDYDGDGKADPAVYRCPTTAAGQCFYYYRGSNANPSGNVTYAPWGFGVGGDFFANPGDFDGDGKYDFCIQRANPSATSNGQFVLRRSSDGGAEYINWGLATDFIVPGDYDGDGKADFCVRRTVSGQRQHFILERDGGGTGASPIVWGVTNDVSTPGDYDGDGRTDIAVWRPTEGNFYLRNSTGNTQVLNWGTNGDFAVAGFSVH